MAKRMSIDDLYFAIEWLSTYDGNVDGEADENVARVERLVTWMQREIAHREHDAIISAAVRQTGASRAVARTTLKRLATKG